MAKPAKPEHSAEFQIEIRNFSDYVGESRGSFFTKIPVYFHTERELDLAGDLFKFFFRLVYLGARQRTPGVLRSTPLRLSRECYCHPESVLPYLQRLIQCQLIQQVGAASPSRVEERKEEERREERPVAAVSSSPFKKLMDPFYTELEETFAIMPREIRTAMSLELGFQSHYVAAIDDEHKLTEDRFKEMIYSGYPGKCRDFDFAFSYCRLVLHSNRGVTMLRSAIQKYAGTRESNFQQLENFLRTKWWEFLRDEKGNWPKSMRENLPAAMASGSDIIYQIGQ